MQEDNTPASKSLLNFFREGWQQVLNENPNANNGQVQITTMRGVVKEMTALVFWEKIIKEVDDSIESNKFSPNEEQLAEEDYPSEDDSLSQIYGTYLHRLIIEKNNWFHYQNFPCIYELIEILLRNLNTQNDEHRNLQKQLITAMKISSSSDIHEQMNEEIPDTYPDDEINLTNEEIINAYPDEESIPIDEGITDECPYEELSTIEEEITTAYTHENANLINEEIAEAHPDEGLNPVEEEIYEEETEGYVNNSQENILPEDYQEEDYYSESYEEENSQEYVPPQMPFYNQMQQPVWYPQVSNQFAPPQVQYIPRCLPVPMPPPNIQFIPPPPLYFRPHFQPVPWVPFQPRSPFVVMPVPPQGVFFGSPRPQVIPQPIFTSPEINAPYGVPYDEDNVSPTETTDDVAELPPSYVPSSEDFFPVEDKDEGSYNKDYNFEESNFGQELHENTGPNNDEDNNNHQKKNLDVDTVVDNLEIITLYPIKSTTTTIETKTPTLQETKSKHKDEERIQIDDEEKSLLESMLENPKPAHVFNVIPYSIMLRADKFIPDDWEAPKLPCTLTKNISFGCISTDVKPTKTNSTNLTPQSSDQYIVITARDQATQTSDVEDEIMDYGAQTDNVYVSSPRLQ